MSIIKIIILFIYDLFKKTLLLENLSKKESLGVYTLLTKFRLFPHSKIAVPFSLGRTIRGVSFDKNINMDPYGRLCKEISNKTNRNIILKNLSKTLIAEKKLNAGDMLKLHDNDKLKNYPSWSIVMPWEKIDIENRFKNYPNIFYKNRVLNGFDFKDNSRNNIINEMHSIKILENKINQMEKLYCSINQNYKNKKISLPKIFILVNKNEWRWVMGDAGNHRSYILSNNKNKFFSARVVSIIKRENVSKWYNVKNGTYSIIEARDIFDSYFYGNKVLRGII